MVEPYDQHKKLFSDTGLKLGKVLWHLLSAQQQMDNATHTVEMTDEKFIAKRNRTEFGDEVGKDEIYWWVYKKDHNIKELQTKVEQTLRAIQVLKEASSKLEPYGIETYEDLIALLAEFVARHKEQIDELHDFVVWLHVRNSLAPAILFTYRVWGSTRRSDRWLDLDCTNIEDENVEVVWRLTEIACGLARSLGYTRFFEMMDIGSEIYDSDPENFHSRQVPEHQVVARTARKALDEFGVFFEELRDSLRNIALDIEIYLAAKNLLNSESFWRRFILKAKAPGRVEATLWDFKESLEMWRAPGTKSQVDFCKLVAAFANNEGGVIIIGITDESRDVVGVPDLEDKLKATSEAIRRWLDYPKKDGVVHLQPVLFESKGKVSCLVVAVAQAADVVGVRGLAGEYYYPDRDHTGLVYRERGEIETRKMHLKAGDNFGFIKELDAFLHDQ